jgi:hypothetical protein
LPNWLFPALILSIDRNPAAFSALSKADPQPKSDGLLALVQRNRSWHDNATASEKVCLDEDMVRVGLDVGTATKHKKKSNQPGLHTA